MTVVGNGEDHWLNDEWWDVTAESNSMNEIAKRVYEITYHNIPKNNNYIVKFVANHSYADHWGSATDEFIAESGVEFNSAYFGENIRFNVPYDCADVTLKLDLTNFNYSSKLGAVAKVTVTDTTNNDNPATENISAQSLSRAVEAVDSVQTADLNGLVPNEDYIIATVKSASEKDVLSDDNLLYITQTAADENGCVSLNYLPKEETENSVIVYYGANIKNAEVTIEPIYYNENEQQADYSVSYGGKVLTKDIDYTISIDENVTELGNYSVKITGIGGYCGTKYVTFSVALKAGDVDGDGFVDINDVTALQTYLSKIDNMSYYQKNSADVTKDNVIDINDATMIQRYCAELCMIS
ncbi:dockerin type I repeat-containing protein [Ruminococcus sp.]|uniref:dockerin type I repeat-containing protein n=1 Tax=Ruminococcus sp. TaxID=41978 RepID=UPI00386405DA